LLGATEVGAEDLMQLLKNYSRQHGTQMKAEISLPVVGIGPLQLAKTIKRQHSFWLHKDQIG
jgi:hypothetical protein